MNLPFVNCRVIEELMGVVSQDHLGLLGLPDLPLCYMMYVHT